MSSDRYVKLQKSLKEKIAENKENIYINKDFKNKDPYFDKEESIKLAELNEIELKGKTEFYWHRSMLS